MLRDGEVFIRRQRSHQLTWQAEPRDREGGPRVCSCTHHSAVQSDPWPHRGCLPASVGFIFPAIVIFSCPHLDRALSHKRSSLSSKPGVTGGQWGTREAEVEAVPSRGWPQQCCQLPVAPLWRCIVTQKKDGERSSLVGVSFQEWWHFLLLSLTDPALISAPGRERELGDNGGPYGPDGSWKHSQWCLHNKDGHITTLSNVENDLLKASEMVSPYCMGSLLCKSLFLNAWGFAGNKFPYVPFKVIFCSSVTFLKAVRKLLTWTQSVIHELPSHYMESRIIIELGNLKL